MIASLESQFLLPILCSPYIVLLLLVTVNKLFKKLHILNNFIDVCLLLTVKNLSATNSISSISSFQLRFNLGKPRTIAIFYDCCYNYSSFSQFVHKVGRNDNFVGTERT